MANAIPVTRGDNAVEKKQDDKKPAKSETTPAPSDDSRPPRGVPYRLPSGTMCVDH